MKTNAMMVDYIPDKNYPIAAPLFVQVLAEPTISNVASWLMYIPDY
jgi:hypothetical protein